MHSNNMTRPSKKLQLIKSAEFNIGEANHDLKKSFPSLQFIQNRRGGLEATGNMEYLYIP